MVKQRITVHKENPPPRAGTGACPYTAPRPSLRIRYGRGGALSEIHAVGLLRAERDGGNDGRVYHINFTATGASGSCTGSVTVGVPHSQGNNGGPVDQGPLYNSPLP